MLDDVLLEHLGDLLVNYPLLFWLSFVGGYFYGFVAGQLNRVFDEVRASVFVRSPTECVGMSVDDLENTCPFLGGQVL